MSTQEHDLQRKREVGGEAGVRHQERGLKREGVTVKKTGDMKGNGEMKSR